MKISPYDLKQGFLCYKTNKYALHYMETPTGLKFVLNTDVNAQRVPDILQQLYSNVRHDSDQDFCVLFVSCIE